jgi:teichuronic acid exporter
MTLKEQAITGVVWSSAGTISLFAIEFVIGIILARLLTPSEFGLIGTITVIIAISQVFVNSGFSQALVRQQNCTQEDYSTAFFFNLIIGVAFFLVLLVSAESISIFFNNPSLKPLIQVLGLTLIINALTLVQNARLIKEINFKLLTRVTVIASVVSGIIAVVMALGELGVWCLIAKTLINQGLVLVMLWHFNRWKPNLVFKKDSFMKLFGFGSKLLFSGLIGTIFNNLYYATIAKYFSVQTLGYYTRAELFKNFPSQTVEKVITSVGYPLLAKVQNDSIRLNSGFRQIFTITFYIVSILMFGLAAVADSMIITLVGEQWRGSIVYLQMLCFVGLLYPLNSININLLNVIGRSDLYLKLQLISQLLTIPIILIAIVYGIKVMILGICINSLFAYFYFTKVASRFSGYGVSNQIKDIMPHLSVALFMGLIVFLVDFLTNLPPFITLVIQILTGIIIVISLSKYFKIKEYMFIREVVIQKIRGFKYNK